MSTKDNADHFADEESRTDEMFSRHSAKASVFCLLHFGQQTKQVNRLNPEERKAVKREQCRSAGKRGGEGRSKAWAAVREFARMFAADNRKATAGQTAYAIHPTVLEKASELGLRMSPSNAPRKIRKWLREDEIAHQR